MFLTTKANVLFLHQKVNQGFIQQAIKQKAIIKGQRRLTFK